MESLDAAAGFPHVYCRLEIDRIRRNYGVRATNDFLIRSMLPSTSTEFHEDPPDEQKVYLVLDRKFYLSLYLSL